MASMVLSSGVCREGPCLSSCMASSSSGRRRVTLLCAAAGTSPLHSSSVGVQHSARPVNNSPPVITQTQFSSSTASEPVSLPPLNKQNLLDHHLFLFTTVVCVTCGAVTALFVAAIPTLLSFKRAAESLEKLLDVTREELPGTMAAVRLSGMEISDLTMELSELGQEISSGVKNSARAVRAAQDGLRRVSSITSMVFLQKPRALPQLGSMKRPAAAAAARGLHDRVIEVRMILRGFSLLKYVMGWIGKLWQTRRRRHLPTITGIHLL